MWIIFWGEEYGGGFWYIVGMFLHSPLSTLLPIRFSFVKRRFEGFSTFLLRFPLLRTFSPSPLLPLLFTATLQKRSLLRELFSYLLLPSTLLCQFCCSSNSWVLFVGWLFVCIRRCLEELVIAFGEVSNYVGFEVRLEITFNLLKIYIELTLLLNWQTAGFLLFYFVFVYVYIKRNVYFRNRSLLL